MDAKLTDELKVVTDGGRQRVLVPYGRGEELRLHLASHGFAAQVRRSGGREWVDVAADPVVLQAIVDEWER
jgi:hypothetical protein